jgi:hypothetical protein
VRCAYVGDPQREKTIAACQEEATQTYPNAKACTMGQYFMTCTKAKGFTWSWERPSEDLAAFLFIAFVRSGIKPKDISISSTAD